MIFGAIGSTLFPILRKVGFIPVKVQTIEASMLQICTFWSGIGLILFFLYVCLAGEKRKMRYGYVRVSTSSQNTDRQVGSLEKVGITSSNIYIDKESGKDFKRTNYKKLIKRLKPDDVVFVKSIDRFGRNYAMILEEWRVLTKEKGVDIVVIDMPLLVTRIEGKNLVGKFIVDVVLQVLSFVAESERETMKRRQAEGIKMAKLRHVRFGRPPAAIPDNFNTVSVMYRNSSIISEQACVKSGLSRGTFFRKIKGASIENDIYGSDHCPVTLDIGI